MQALLVGSHGRFRRVAVVECFTQPVCGLISYGAARIVFQHVTECLCRLLIAFHLEQTVADTKVRLIRVRPVRVPLNHQPVAAKRLFVSSQLEETLASAELRKYHCLVLWVFGNELPIVLQCLSPLASVKSLARFGQQFGRQRLRTGKRWREDKHQHQHQCHRIHAARA